MDYTVIDFAPCYEISYAEYRTICDVVGLSFENKTLSLDFGEVIYRPMLEGDFLQLRILHIGIEADLYVRGEDIHRLLGVDIKYLSEDYLSFLVTKHFSKYGVFFCKLNSEFNERCGVILKAVLTTDNIQQTELFIDVESLVVESERLSMKKNKLSGDLSLATSVVPFKTYLSPGELECLNPGDVVLIYPE
ncbi:hypothetical protein [Citrobacter portucalensis]|uniref:hypothetical protein n=1 Tax=Citrobacter portucalensis TaxID=1639133 RepID=UPI00226B0365|nr:hypothetical protein [Citrobacter portucalensis]MCX8986015.1 hypothetical protein [Citrobacter portucalensis]